jgi:hypothetical protein
LRRDDPGDRLDGCDLVDFSDPRFLTADDDREGFLEPRTVTDEAEPDTTSDELAARGFGSPTDRAEHRLGRGERVG